MLEVELAAGEPGDLSCHSLPEGPYKFLRDSRYVVSWGANLNGGRISFGWDLGSTSHF